MSEQSMPSNTQSSAQHDPAMPTVPAEHHARHIAEIVARTWHGASASDRLDVPLSVIATLAAAPALDHDGQPITTILLGCDPNQFRTYSLDVWTAVIRHRPDLTHVISPLILWLFDDDNPELTRHAHSVARAALQAGQLDLTGTDRRFDADVLGATLMNLRPQSAAQTRGQYYTPPDIAELIAHMTAIDGNSTIRDPVMGTGGLFRAAAKALRHRGRNPHTVQWIGCDIDEMAVACGGVNSMIWNLGRDILFYVSNVLQQDEEQRALDRRNELLSLALDVKKCKAIIDLMS